MRSTMADAEMLFYSMQSDRTRVSDESWGEIRCQMKPEENYGLKKAARYSRSTWSSRASGHLA